MTQLLNEPRPLDLELAEFYYDRNKLHILEICQNKHPYSAEPPAPSLRPDHWEVQHWLWFFERRWGRILGYSH